MNKRLKKTVQWTVYLLIVILVLFTLISATVNVIAPTFFPNANIDGFKDYLNMLSVLLSVSSAMLGAYSVWQASKGGKQTRKIIESVQTLKQQQQDIMLVVRENIKESKVNYVSNADSQWEKDNVKA